MTRVTTIVLAFALLASGARAESAAPDGRPMFDPRDFGARSDGVHDDTAAFQAAVDRAGAVGGVVRVPAGRHLVGSIELPSHAAIEGEGAASVLVLKPQPLADGGGERRSPARPGHMFLPKDMATVAAVEGVGIARLTLLGSSREQNGGRPMPLSGAIHGIAVLGGRGWVIREVRVEDFDGDGIYLGANPLFPGARARADGKLVWPTGTPPDDQPMAVGNRVENSVVRGNLRNGMMIAHGDGNVLRGNLFEANQLGVVCVPRAGRDRVCATPEAHPKFSPAVYESAELDLEPNRIRVRPGEPTIWQRVTDTLIEGNTFRNGPHLAVQIAKGPAEIGGNRIVANRFDDNRGGAIVVFAEGAHDTTIEANDFGWSAAAHQSTVIRLHAGDGNRIVANRFQGPLPASGRVVSLEAGSPRRPTRCTAFRDNLVEVPAAPAAAVVAFDRTLVDTLVAGNRFPLGGRLDVAPASLLETDRDAACRP